MELGIWIVWLVRAAWIAAILLMVIGSIPSSKLRLYHELMLSFAGRGKILQPSSSQVLCVSVAVHVITNFKIAFLFNISVSEICSSNWMFLVL